MAIAPTGAIYKSLVFDGEDSRNYGVYITGEAVYNAPGRDVEMVEIPGRNGSFALDKGRFQNIEVSYPAGIFADTEADFAEAISDFRNFLCSRNGYVRLTDEYNPDEYRMAIYKSGLEVTPAQLKAGEFEIVFDCKPQRWLTSGETAITVSSGDTVTNPTLFDASPLLEVEGYGNIDFNGYNIELENETLGTVTLWNSGSYSGQYRHPTITRTFQQGLLNSGDNFTINGLFWSVHHVPFGSSSQLVPSNPTASITVSGIENTISNASGTVRRNEYGDWLVDCDFDVTVPQIGFVFGTAKTEQATVTCNISVVINAETKTKSYVQTVNINYDGNNVVTFEWINQETLKMNFVVPEARGDSSVSLLGHPTYIDCDLGAAYMIKSGDVISLNQYIDLGSELPTLAAGANEITFDNTVTELKIIPRWWKV